MHGLPWRQFRKKLPTPNSALLRSVGLLEKLYINITTRFGKKSSMYTLQCILTNFNLIQRNLLANTSHKTYLRFYYFHWNILQKSHNFEEEGQFTVNILKNLLF